MLKPSELTKAELLQVMEILAESAEYELDRALSQIERQRNEAHYEKSKKLIDEEMQHYRAYLELLRPYAGRPVKEIPADVFKRAMEEWGKAHAAGKEWDKLNGIKTSGRADNEAAGDAGAGCARRCRSAGDQGKSRDGL